jgi:hypothetical protein
MTWRACASLGGSSPSSRAAACMLLTMQAAESNSVPSQSKAISS